MWLSNRQTLIILRVYMLLLVIVLVLAAGALVAGDWRLAAQARLHGLRGTGRMLQEQTCTKQTVLVDCLGSIPTAALSRFK
jgi:hypothetical protein